MPNSESESFQTAVSFWEKAWQAYDDRARTGGNFSLEMDSNGAVIKHSELRGEEPRVERITAGDIPLGRHEVVTAAKISTTPELAAARQMPAEVIPGTLAGFGHIPIPRAEG